MNDSTIPQADMITATPAPLEEQLLRAISDPGQFPLADNAKGERTVSEWSRDAVVQVLHGGGWVIPGAPPASRLLDDARQFAERTILSELAVRLFRTLVLGNIVLPETPAAMDWLKEWIDGSRQGHGPIGKPMIWPDRLPGVANLLRQWGFQPTPTVPPYVMRQPQNGGGRG